MTPREGLLVLLNVAAALVAAIFFRVAARPAELHDPRYAERFERAREALPILDAVHVRSSEPDAAHRLVTDSGASVGRVLDPARARATFRYGRLLYATPARIEETLRTLKRGELPPRPPPAPDLAPWFRDADGPYTCDVLLRDGAEGLERIRELLPDARLSGEPVVAAAEERAARDLPRALLLGLVMAVVWIAWRSDRLRMERRLLPALVPLTALGATGWGIDVWTVPALIIAATLPRGRPLVCGAPCLLFPAGSLRRLGLVLLLAGILRWRERPPPPTPARRRELALLAVLLVAGWFGLKALPVRGLGPAALRAEPAVRLVPPGEAAATVRALRAEFAGVVGGPSPLPPPADLATRRNLRAIYTLADRMARGATGTRKERLTELAEAAALPELYLPPALRERVRTGDGRAVVWIHDDVPLAREEFVGARLYRLRGEAALRERAVWAALLVFLLAGLGASDPARLLARAAAVAGGVALLVVARHGAPEVYAPLFVIVAMAPGVTTLIGLAAAAAALPSAYLWPVAAFALAAGCGWSGEIIRRRLRS
jgi:hypothetical protein